MQKGLIKLLADNRATPRIGCKAEQNGADSTTLYLYDPIVRDQWEAEMFGGVTAKELAIAIAAVDTPKLHIRIDSPGGDVFAAQAIAQALREYAGEATAHIDGICASAATIIAIACARVEMAVGAMFMVHRAWSIAVGNTNDFLEMAALLDKTDGVLAAQYAAKTKQSAADCLAMMDAETWLTAEEAIAAGFVDDAAPVIKADARKWNLAAYQKAPPGKPETAPKPAEPDCVSADHRARQSQRLATLERLAITH